MSPMFVTELLSLLNTLFSSRKVMPSRSPSAKVAGEPGLWLMRHEFEPMPRICCMRSRLMRGGTPMPTAVKLAWLQKPRSLRGCPLRLAPEPTAKATLRTPSVEFTASSSAPLPSNRVATRVYRKGRATLHSSGAAKWKGGGARVSVAPAAPLPAAAAEVARGAAPPGAKRAKLAERASGAPPPPCTSTVARGATEAPSAVRPSAGVARGWMAPVGAAGANTPSSAKRAARGLRIRCTARNSPPPSYHQPVVARAVASTNSASTFSAPQRTLVALSRRTAKDV